MEETNTSIKKGANAKNDKPSDATWQTNDAVSMS